jgi:hypothetical protein
MRTALITGALAIATTVAGTTTAAAEAPGPWIRYHQPEVTIAAGTGCDFEVLQEVLADGEYYRDVATYDDGTPRVQQWKGPLVMRWSNTETGDSAVVDLTGRAVITYRPDGSDESITIVNGHFGARMPAGSNVPRGVYRVGGKDSSVRFNDDGTRTLTLGRHGTAENLCDELDD